MTRPVDGGDRQTLAPPDTSDEVGGDRISMFMVGTVVLSIATAFIVASTRTPAPTAAPVDPQTPVEEPAAPAAEPREAPNVIRAADDVGTPVGARAAQAVTIELETTEVEGQLADGTTYTYWTFGGTVPGPMVRARVGDTVTVRLTNSPESGQAHSIDLHATNGPGGGAVVMQVPPGETKEFTFLAMNPGVYVYHCATAHIPTHIANGMYGLIVIEPEGGLAAVDREFYVMQGEFYTTTRHGTPGLAQHDFEAMLDEDPEYVVFNGAVAGLTGEHAMHADVGDAVRVFVGNGGPNLISSFHVIGEVFDRVYAEGASEASSNVQTTLIPAGGAAVVEFTVDVPGNYLFVDHSITRTIDRGALGILEVTGEGDPAIFDGEFPEDGDTAGH